MSSIISHLSYATTPLANLDRTPNEPGEAVLGECDRQSVLRRLAWTVLQTIVHFLQIMPMRSYKRFINREKLHPHQTCPPIRACADLLQHDDLERGMKGRSQR